MGVYIPNIEKPKTREDCPCAYFTEGAYTDECQVTHKHITDEKPTDCPLIEIVRCEDCKHYGFKETDRGGFPCCTNEIGATPYRMPTDFCSYGERRAE